MAYLVDYALTQTSAAGTSVALNMPSHQANDILLIFTVEDGIAAGATANATPGVGSSGGFNQLSNTELNVISTTGLLSAAFYRVATKSTETANVTFSTSDYSHTIVLSVRDANTANPINANTSSNTNTTTANTFTLPSITTTQNDCLLLYFSGIDGVAPGCLSDPGPCHFINSSDNGQTTATTSAALAAGWYMQRTPGSTPNPGWSISAAAAHSKFVIAINNAINGRIPAYIDDVTMPGKRIAGGHHVGTLNGISFPASLTGSANTISGKTLTYSAAAVGADFGINSYSNAIGKTSAIVAATSLAGFEIGMGLNANTGLIAGALIAGSPKMGTYGLGTIPKGGYTVRVGSSATNWCAYQVAASNSIPTTEQRSVFVIEPGYTGTSYGTPGSAINTSAITYMQFLLNCPDFATIVYLSDLNLVYPQVVSGGDANYPVDSAGLAQVGSSFRIPLIQKSGAYGVISYAPIQIGGGDAVNFQIDSGTLQFPRRYDTTTRELAFHCSDEKVGIEYYGKPGDVIKHTNSVISSPTPYYWKISPLANTLATWDFTGTSIIGANTTLRNVTTFDSMIFSSFTKLDTSGCTVTNSTLNKVPASNNSLLVTSTSNIDYCKIYTTTISQNNYLCSIADPTIFVGCEFYGSNTSGSAIRITSPGTYAFVGNKFYNYGNSNTSSASIFNDSGGLVTLNISGGGTTPTYRNGTSANTVINNTVSLTLTGLQPNSNINFISSGTITERLEVMIHPLTSYVYSYAYTAGTFIDIGVQKSGYVPFYIRGYELGATDASLPIAQVADRNFI